MLTVRYADRDTGGVRYISIYKLFMEEVVRNEKLVREAMKRTLMKTCIERNVMLLNLDKSFKFGINMSAKGGRFHLTGAD